MAYGECTTGWISAVYDLSHKSRNSMAIMDKQIVKGEKQAGQEPEQVPPQTRVLFVDDEKNILSSLRRVFRSEGYELLTAMSGNEALEILKEKPVDLVISDMRMPEMDGSEFLACVADKWPETVRMLLTGYADLTSTIDAINKGRIYGYFSKPWEDNEIRLSVKRALETKNLEEQKHRLQKLTEEQNKKLQEWNETLEQRVKARTEELDQANMFLELAYQQLKESYYDAIPIFANLVQLREGKAKGHSKRVADLARDVAERMQMDEDDVRHVHFAGLLHNIGKLAMPDELLRIPHDRLEARQRKIVERHPNIGASILMGLEPLHKTALFIRQHHENVDGKGYPAGLLDGEIALGARILMACNEYDGLRHGMQLGDDMGMADAMDYMHRRAGKRYDEQVLNALFAVLKERQSSQDNVREHRLEPASLQSGMRLSRDLLSAEGVLLLSRNHILDEGLIDKIVAFNHDSGTHVIVHVYAEGRSDESNNAGG